METPYEGEKMIDLDQARQAREAARKEAEEKGPIVMISGEELELAPEMPYEVLEAFKGMKEEETAGAAMAEIVEAMLGEHYPKFRAMKPPPTLTDVEVLVAGLMSEYGIENPLA